jgi:hypothetical protein
MTSESNENGEMSRVMSEFESPRLAGEGVAFGGDVGICLCKRKQG